MDLSKKYLPSCVKVGGQSYPIYTDFRRWINFSRLIKKEINDLTVFDSFYDADRGDVPNDRAAGLSELIKFYSPDKVLPRKTEGENVEQVLDYDLDADLIYSAFMREYGLDLFTVDLHWHKFTALLSGLKDSKLTDIISYRLWTDTGRNDDYDKHMRKLQSAWALEDIQDQEEIDEALKRFNEWATGKRK